MCLSAQFFPDNLDNLRGGRGGLGEASSTGGATLG